MLKIHEKIIILQYFLYGLHEILYKWLRKLLISKKTILKKAVLHLLVKRGIKIIHI